MIHLLPPHPAIVHDDPEAVGAARLAGELPRAHLDGVLPLAPDGAAPADAKRPAQPGALR